MMHPDQEMLALYIGGDLSLDETAAVKEHLITCPSCSSRAAAFDRQSALLREAVLELPGSRPGRAPRRSWAPAVAAAVLLAFAVAFAASPTLARAVVRLFPFGQVRELGPQEVAEELRRMDATPHRYGGTCDPYSDLEEAAAVWGQQPLEPAYLPEGFRPRSYTPCQIWFSTTYRHTVGSSFTITQGGQGGIWNTPEGTVEEVKVNGRPGVVIRGTWSSTNGIHQWEPDMLQLWFEHEGRSVSIHQMQGTSYGVNLTVEEMIKIAESLR